MWRVVCGRESRPDADMRSLRRDQRQAGSASGAGPGGPSSTRSSEHARSDLDTVPGASGLREGSGRGTVGRSEGAADPERLDQEYRDHHQGAGTEDDVERVETLKSCSVRAQPGHRQGERNQNKPRERIEAAARPCASSRPTAPTSIPSRKRSRGSRPCCAKQASGLSAASGS